MVSHGNSLSFLVTTRLGGGLVQIYTKFHDYSMSFIQVLFAFHTRAWHGFWMSSNHGISMAFAKKMMGFPPDLVSFSNQTKLPSKRHEEIRVIFFTGDEKLLCFFPFFSYPVVFSCMYVRLMGFPIREN